MANEHSNKGSQSLDHLQDDFNNLISEDSPYEEPTDAFNDLAGAFAVGDTSESNHDQSSTETTPASNTDENHDDFVAHLNKSINELKSTAASSNTPADFMPITEDDIPHDTLSHLDVDPAEFEAIQDPESLFEDEAPVYADLSGNEEDENRPKSHIIVLVSAILIATAGGLYWYTMGSTKQPDQTMHIVKGEQLQLPKQTPQQSNIIIPETLSTAEAIKLVTQKQTNKQATPKQAPTIMPEILSTTEAIKLVTQKQASQSVSEKPATIKPITPIKKALAIAPSTSSKVSSNNKVAEKKTTNQVFEVNAQPIVKNWIIVATVSSNKMARQYIARFRTQHINSEIVQLKSNGETRHFIRITGFSTQHAAQKQRDNLVKTLGLQNARIQQL